MNLYWKLAITAVGVIVAIWLVFSWFEAEKEIRILCSNFHSGQDMQSLLETLETGEYLRYQLEESTAGESIVVNSYYNLKTSRCVITTSESEVISSVYSGPVP